MPGELADVIAAHHAGVEQPRAVHMHQQSVRVSPFADSLDMLQRVGSPAPLVRRVLQAEQARNTEVLVVRSDFGGQIRDVDHAVPAGDRPAGDAAERRRTARLIIGDVSQLLDQQFVPLLAVRPDRHLVRLRPRTVVNGGFHPQQIGDVRLQPVDRRVFPGHVVADFRLGNGLPHAGSRFRDGVAAQIDHVIHGLGSQGAARWRKRVCSSTLYRGRESPRKPVRLIESRSPSC